ncbi:MAG: NUDIX domain-containing protein [bacterium]|nr:NUDIX domain-containing protein [bacterium]
MNQKKTIQKSKRKRVNSRLSTKAIREYSAGGVVFRKTNGDLQFLLIQDPKKRWNLPKGHIESGETPEQSAIREVSEETNLKELKIISKLDKIHFFYRMNGKLIFMTNFVYLIESKNPNEKLKTEKDAPWIVDVKWFEAKQAYNIVEYKATKLILREAIKKIKE